MDETRTLASFLVGLKYEDLSDKLIQATKDHVLDTFGVQLAMSTKPWSLAVYKYVRELGGQGGSTIVNYGDRVRPENAAFVNGTFGHGFETDDAYLAAVCHPGVVVVSAALAMAEHYLADGKSFLLAVVAGYEAMGRAARSVSPSCSTKGFHPTSAAGPFGSAAAAGKMLGFDDGLMVNALSIAGSHASGLSEFHQTGGAVKRMHAGLAASGGIRAALLAKAGLTGPPTCLEGKKGFCHAFSDNYNLSELTSGLGEQFIVFKTAFKLHSCCYQIQAPVDATRKILRDHSVAAGQIAEIVMGTSREGISSVGTILEPEDITGAQFSAPFTLALFILRGSCGVADYTDANLCDPEIRKFARRIRLEVDDEMQSLYPATRAARITVRLRDGRTYQQVVEHARGTPENPLTRDEVQAKFRQLAGAIIADKKIEQIVRIVETLESQQNLVALGRLLAV